ncbi:MAG: M24 family metallopeptidase [Polyangiaceae bacterium]
MQTALAFPSTDVSRYPSDADLRGYDRAQSFAKMIARSVAARLELGMSERDATALTYDVFREHGVRDHWHMPVVGVAEGSTKFTSAGRFLHHLFGGSKRILRDGDILFLDIAPMFEGYPSDFTLTHLYGENARLARMIDTACTLTRRVSNHLREDMRAGDAWTWIKKEIESACPYELQQFPISPVAHRFAKLPMTWPVFREVGTVHLLLMGNPLMLPSSKTSMRGLWVIEPLLVDRELDRAAKTEEIVFVTEAETMIFGEEPFVA